jgi:prophage antirepressor-like protein
MDNLARVFQYRNTPVRSIVRNNDPWFIAKDVCAVLDLARTDRAVAGLSPRMKGTHIVSTPGGNQTMTVISEAGVYKLVFQSRKPEAEAFTDWLAEEVIPAIRRTGQYTANPSPDANLIGSLRGALTAIQERKAKANLEFDQAIAAVGNAIKTVEHIRLDLPSIPAAVPALPAPVHSQDALSALNRLTQRERRIVDQVLGDQDETGWTRTAWKQVRFAEMTGMFRSHVGDSLNLLLRDNVLSKRESALGFRYKYNPDRFAWTGKHAPK